MMNIWYGAVVDSVFFGSSFWDSSFWGLGRYVKFLFIVSVIGRLHKIREMKGNDVKKGIMPSFIVGKMMIALHIFVIEVIIMDEYINALHKSIGSDVLMDFMIGYELLDSMYSFMLHISRAGAIIRYINVVNMESCAIHLNLFSEN